MRVGVDARLLYYRQGGISTYVSCLLRELSVLRRDERYVVLRSRKDANPIPSGEGLGGERLKGEGFEVVRSWTPCHHRFEQLTLPLELIPLRLDLLHSPDFIPPLHRRCKAVITVHDLAFLKYPHLLTADSRAYYQQIDKAVVSADAIIAVSTSTKKDLVDLLAVSDGKISVIPEAADTVFYPMDHQGSLDLIKQRYGLPERFILFVGTIEPRKNLPTLIEAFAKLHRERAAGLEQEGRPVKLVIAGGRGWLCDEVFTAVTHLGIDSLVSFIGPVAQQDLAMLYNLALVLAMPSLYEGFGLPVLEAMACGTPVIAANTSSLPEVAGNAALLVEPLDVDGWARALAQVLESQSVRDDLRQKGLLRAKGFSWARTAAETRALYGRVLGG